MASGIAMGVVPEDAPLTVESNPVPGQELRNHTEGSKSPFVQRLRDSLVAWQLLDDETVERARRENKLIFLHIGYHACHFCRLMAAETFSNPDCAAVINESFIPVVVDREERPDLDIVYMNYVQAISNAGGWPLNLFLTPKLEPVFGSTYWPGPGATRKPSAESGEEVMDFLMILTNARNIWRDQEAKCRDEAVNAVVLLKEFAQEGTLSRGNQARPRAPTGIGPIGMTTTPEMIRSQMNQPSAGADDEKNSKALAELDIDLLEEAYTHIAGTFDPVYGGFGLAPKFLTPPKLNFLLQLLQFPSEVQDVVGQEECKNAQYMAINTLRKIRDSALRDHIGGAGFARCSVTPDWSIPNFERLVVDNALLLSLFLEAWRVGGGEKNGEFYEIVIELVDYLTQAPIALPGGGFASSEAADSYNKKGDKEMREGAYYVWTRREFDSVVDEADKHVTQVAAAYWNVLEDGNVDEDHDPNDDFMNQNVLRVVRSVDDLAKQFGTPVEQVEQYVKQAKQHLRAKRDEERPRPSLDAKAVTGWNGLVVSALAKTATALKELSPEESERCLVAARGAIELIKDKLWDAERKVLFRIWNNGRAVEGFAEDYAYLTAGLLDLFDATGDESLVELADTIQTTQISLFYDPDGAFYSTTSAPSSSQAIIRLKDGMDTSLPSVNAVSVSNLYRLGSLLNDDDFAVTARKSIDAFEPEMLEHPWLFPGLLAGVVTARLGSGADKVTELKYKETRQKV